MPIAECYQLTSYSHQYEEWNDHDRLLRGYIKTRAQPPIFFRPAQHVPRTEELQQQSTAKIEGVCVCVHSLAHGLHLQLISIAFEHCVCR